MAKKITLQIPTSMWATIETLLASEPLRPTDLLCAVALIGITKASGDRSLLVEAMGLYRDHQKRSDGRRGEGTNG